MQQVADLINIKCKTYQQWERNINPSNNGLLALGKLYDIPLEILLEVDVSTGNRKVLVSKEHELYSRFIIQPNNIKKAILGLLEMKG